MAHLYLLDATAELTQGSEVSLLGDEARHAASVGRIGAGEETLVGNGVGRIARARALKVSPKEVVLEVLDVRNDDPVVPEIWLVQALAKGDRDERAIQACTELGVDRIIPWASARSVSVWRGEKARSGVERWRRIATEASKQSLRSRVPVVQSLVTSSEVLNLAQDHHLVVLHPDAPTRLMDLAITDDRPLVMVVGAEGGLSPAEIEELTRAGAGLYRLGKTVLRTSSAGPAALAVLNGALGRW